MYLSEVEIGHTFIHPRKGEGVIIARTKRTLTAKFKCSTTKVTYRHGVTTFYPTDF